MPRLALQIDPHAAPEELERLADRWERLRDRSHRPVHRARTLLPGALFLNGLLGFFPNVPQPATSPDGATSLWLDGEVWDRKGAREAAGLPADWSGSDAELCLALYLRQGERFCERLNGQFVIAVYEPARERLLLCNDRYAFRPVFWRHDGATFTAASEAKAILAAEDRQPELDPAGVIELFAYKHQLGERTLFRGVKVLLPGTRLIFERGRVTQERYWRLRYPQQLSRASEGELIEELAQRLRAACARQSAGPGRVGMALSAGLDSRVVIAALPEGAKPQVTYTIGYPDSLDLLGARQLAETYRVRHLHLVPQDGYLSRVGPEVVWRMEGAFPFFNATSVQFHERLRPELDIILAGHAGGDLSGQLLLPVPPGARRASEVESYLHGQALAVPQEQFRELFPAPVWAEEWTEIRRHFRHTVEELGDTIHRIEDAVTEWFIEQGESRFTNHSGQVDRHDFEVRAPLLDYDLVDFFLTLPYEYRFAQRLYKRTLAHAFPEAARIPWSKTGKAVPGTAAEILSEFYLGGLKRKLLKRMPGKKERVRTLGVIGEEMRRDPEFRTRILDPFIDGQGFPDEVLSREGVRRLVDDHWSGTVCRSHEVGCLATVAMAHHSFLEGGLQAPERFDAPDHPALLEAA